MYPNRPPFRVFFEGLSSLCLFTLATIPALASSKMPDDYCENAAEIGLNTTLRDIEAHCYEAYIEYPGILWLDVAVPVTAAAEAQLTFFGQACSDPLVRAPEFAYIERYVTSMLIEIRAAGSYLFCVAPQDPVLQLGEYKLRTAFVDVEKGGDPDEDVPDLDPLNYSYYLKGGDPDEDVPDPDPLNYSSVTGPEGPWRKTLLKLCLLGEIDDHGDALGCATHLELGSPLHGEIDNEWADDDDTFAFFIREFQTIEIQTRGETDTAGALYNRYGHRLTVDDDGGEGGNFRIAKTLAPGLYFVRIQGRLRSEGAYRLAADAMSHQ